MDSFPCWWKFWEEKLKRNSDVIWWPVLVRCDEMYDMTFKFTIWCFCKVPARKLSTWCKRRWWWWTVLPAALPITGGRSYRESRLINDRCWGVRIGDVQTIVWTRSAVNRQEFFWSLAVKGAVVRKIGAFMASLLVVVMHFTIISRASSTSVVLQIRWKVISLLAIQCRIWWVVTIIVEVVQAIN